MTARPTTARAAAARPAVGRRGHQLAAGAAALALLTTAGLAALAGDTDAAYVSQEVGAGTVVAGTVQKPTLVCSHSGVNTPHVLKISPATGGLPVVGYRVVAQVTSPAHPGGDWNSTHLPVLDETRWFEAPSGGGAVTVQWGVQGAHWNVTHTGKVTVTAVGPGGWTSEAVDQDWKIVWGGWGSGTPSCGT